MRKMLLFFVVLVVSCFSIDVNAGMITKEWAVKQGGSWWDAINWSHTTEVSDGYITATLDDEGYGIMRKYSKDGKLLWETENYYGYFYGGFEIYKDHIYTLVYDVRYGIYLYKYDMNGKYVDAVGIYTISLDENPYIYAGELFLVDDAYFTIYYANGDRYGTYPEYFFFVDANTFEYDGYEDPYDLSEDYVEEITNGNMDYLSLDYIYDIYEENGYNSYFYQTLRDENYKYFIGTLYNDTDAIGVIVKTDMKYNIVSVVKSDKKNEVYYDAAMVGNGSFIVSSYTTEWQEKYPNGMTSYIKVFDENLKETEKHNISEELGVKYTDVICLSNLTDSFLLQVIGGTDKDINSYFLKYTKPYAIEKKISNGGSVVINENALFGELVTFSVTPMEGYMVKNIKITDMEGNVIDHDNYTFVMPASNVNIDVEFVPVLKENPKTGIVSYTLIGTLILLVGVCIYKHSRKFKVFR